ncbi:uncharacterized protein LOC134239073 [Saccostrea cucullata]|uniref:uncharacterized protein LOC134239073 n=1 Tax=Saccostrea cuccullata TaxID=36930 RepID=UPI002ED1EB46
MGLKMNFMDPLCVVLILITLIFQTAECFSPGGSVYTRWGRTDCSETASLIYSGYVGGSHYLHPGAAVEPLCLPKDPEWGRYYDYGEHQRGFVYGAEYEHTGVFRLHHLQDLDVPCAVCETLGQKSVFVIPARKTCYSGWKKEYSGYLMSGNFAHRAASTYSCFDEQSQSLDGGSENKDGYLFYPVESRCHRGSLRCPPYKEGRELTCVVCSKD